MQNPSYCQFPVLLLVAAALCSSIGIHAQVANTDSVLQPALTIKIIPVQPTVKAGSKVLVDVTLKNLSSDTVESGGRVGDDGFEYPMEVRDEKGAGSAETKYGRLKNNHATPQDFAEGTAVIQFKAIHRLLDPGMSVTDHVNVSREYDLSRPGKYTIQVKYYDTRDRRFIESNKVTVTVTP